MPRNFGFASWEDDEFFSPLYYFSAFGFFFLLSLFRVKVGFKKNLSAWWFVKYPILPSKYTSLDTIAKGRCIKKGSLTQCASKRDHLRDMKIANFQNLFRGSWGCWENPLRPKNFGPGCTGRPVRPILSAIFGYFSNFERQKNPIKCSVLTTSLHLGGQLGQLGSHESKIGLGTATQLE